MPTSETTSTAVRDPRESVVDVTRGEFMAIDSRVSKLETTLEERLKSIDGSLAALISTATKDPNVRRHLLSILGSVAVILSIVAAALAGRASSAPPAQAPIVAPAAPTITVVIPRQETPQ